MRTFLVDNALNTDTDTFQDVSVSVYDNGYCVVDGHPFSVDSNYITARLCIWDRAALVLLSAQGRSMTAAEQRVVWDSEACDVQVPSRSRALIQHVVSMSAKK